VEASRRVRTDERFREQVERLEERAREARPERHARLRELVRDDVPVESVARFLTTLANGFAFLRVADEPMPDLDELMTLVETGVAPR
jgi:hypothetical protein